MVALEWQKCNLHFLLDGFARCFAREIVAVVGTFQAM